MTVQQKSGWKSNVGYIWAMIGSAVGFANILSFSAKCYANGGGAFLIPLTIALVVLGVPLLILEGVVGQTFQLPLVGAFGKVAGKKGKFFGWLTVLGVLTIGSYYLVINAWTVAYIYYSGMGSIPADTSTFFAQTFLHDSGSLTTIGSISIPVIIFMALVSWLTWLVTVRNIQKGIEVVCEIFLPILAFLLSVFMISVCFLPGAFQGFKYYLIPDFSKLWDPQLWLISFGHIFFSLSVGLSLIVGYSRYTDKSVNIPRAMILVALGDVLTSFVAGFVIFGGIGYMAHISNSAFADVVTPSIFGLGFVVFPKIFQTFGPLLASFIGSVFFFCLFIAGITGLFSIIEAVAGNFEVEFSWNRRRSVTTALFTIFVMGLLFTAGNGSHLIGAIDGMTAGFNVLVSGFAEIFVFIYLSKEIMNNSAWFQISQNRTFYYYTLKFISPILLLGIFGSSLIKEIQTGFGVEEAIRWGWLLIAGIISAYFSQK